MLISRKRNFIFIHIPKNAGTSITNALLPFTTRLLPIAPLKWQRHTHRLLRRLRISWLNPQPYADHIKGPNLVKQMGRDVFDSFFSFAVVRNPWDWQVSFYNYVLSSPFHAQYKLIKSLGGFDEYIRWRCEQEVWFQRDCIYSDESDLLVDFVARFERIHEDFAEICSHIGVTSSLPKLNLSDRSSYQQYYNAETRELIKRTFEPDIRLFDYDFKG